MTFKEILDKLKSLGNEKVFSHNKKYGAGENQYGVKLGDIRKLAKKIKTNHSLAFELWNTKIIDAQMLGILLFEPANLSAKDLDNLVKSIQFVHVADWFNSYILKDHPEKESLRKKWIKSKNVWALRSAWSLTAGKIVKNNKDLDLISILDQIESEMPKAAPEVQWTMNTALAQIGINHSKHRKRAVEIGERLGIYRDYPVSKGCISPFAPIWINEMVSRQRS